MRTLISLSIAFGCGLSVIVACSGKAVESSNASAGSGGSGESSGSGGTGALGGSGALGGTGALGGAGASAGAAGTAQHGGAGGVANHEPAVHRPSATPCDHVRATTDPGAPDIDAGYVACHAHSDCTAGENGRCVGNGHDGWQCTYDSCFADSDCPSAAGEDPKLCACGGGDRSDNNVCLPGNCRVDKDCGAAGFCSPSLGDCGNYTNFVGYFCHTKQDECSDDSDCGAGGSFGGAYCAFMPTVGFWQCSTSQCVG